MEYAGRNLRSSLQRSNTPTLHCVDSHTQRTRAIALTGFVVLCFVAWLAFEIPKGILTNTDELFTAERSREMLLTNPWTVHFNFQRSVQKPPLQYWLTTLTLPRFENSTLAVRIWPAIYAVLTVIATAWLAFLIDPTRPWLMLLAAAILVSCPLFTPEAGRALLDVGLAFYTTLAIVLAQLACKRPAWWVGVAVVCWLGSLQKIPLIFLVWLVIVVVRLSSASERRERSVLSNWLIASVILAIAATAAWPLIQMTNYGVPLGSEFHKEAAARLWPQHLGTRPYLEIPFRLSMTGWIVGGFFAFIAPFAVLFWREQRFSTAAKEIAIVCITVIALAVLFNFRSVRYIVPIVPCLALLLAIVLHRLIEQRPLIRIGAMALLGTVLLAGIAQAKAQVYFRQRNVSGGFVDGRVRLRIGDEAVADEKRVAEELGALQNATTKTLLIKAARAGSDPHNDSFYLFHGNLRFPVVKLTVEQLRRAPPSPPVAGVCVQRDFPVVQEVYPNVKVEFTRDQFILWRVNAQ
jgi:4-amino-4-deoxy-L-arabinose transferase-like glycosyltransferase